MYLIIHCPLSVLSYSIMRLLLDDESHAEKTLVRTKRYLIEESLRELLETLGAHEALLMVKFPVAVHDLLSRGEAALAALTHGIGQSVGHVAEKRKKTSESGSEYTYTVKTTNRH